MSADQIYGIVSHLPTALGSLVFLIILIILTLLECFFKALQSLADDSDFEHIFQKLKQELMMLGLVSFIVFVVESSTLFSISDNENLNHAFEFAHITVFFMALAFM